MKKVFLSLPMHGRNDDDIWDELFSIQKYLEKKIFKGEDFEITHNMLSEPELDLYNSLDGVKHKRLLYLGAAITKLSQCDYALFAPGWKGANGCQIEYMVCRAYGIKTIMM